jgi:hypothetical protein
MNYEGSFYNSCKHDKQIYPVDPNLLEWTLVDEQTIDNKFYQRYKLSKKCDKSFHSWFYLRICKV